MDIRGDKRQYTPRSDALLSINSLPHLLLEVVSDEDHEWDRFRMLLQAACLARLRRALRQESADPFIVSAIYIDSNLRAAWYLLYQPDWSNTAVGLILQEATPYLRLGRLDMWWMYLILKIQWRRSSLCFGSTT